VLKLKRLLIVLALYGLPAQLSAGIIYNNVGGGFPGDSPGSYNFGGPNGFEGTTFISTGGGNLSTISLDLGGSVSPITGGLYTNSAGEPGTLLESWTFAQPISPISPPPLTTLTSAVHPLLSSGTQYWFVVSLPNTGQGEGLFENDTAVAGGVWTGFAINTLTQSFASGPAVAIQVTSTPEPTTMLLVLSGLCLCGFSRLRTKR
jgi:hypothetical protein